MRKKIIASSLFLLYILIIVLFNQTGTKGLVTEQNSSNPDYISDKFFIGNTSEQKTLFQFEYMGIGVTYNVTIDLHVNSSTGVSFSIFNESGKEITGEKTFTLEPNETRTETYISHYYSDAIPSRRATFQLIDETKNASGNYQVQKTQEEYNPYPLGWPSIITGSVYVGNITEWLKEVSSKSSNISTTTSKITSITSFTSNEWFVGVILFIIYFRRKNRK